MKRLILIIVIVLFIAYPLVSTATYLIQLKNGGRYVTFQYWEEGDEIKFYYHGGVLGFRKSLIKSIEETDLRYKEVIEEKAAETSETQGKKDRVEIKKEGKEIDAEYYKDKKATLMGEYRDVQIKVQQAMRNRDIEAKLEARKELKGLGNQISELENEIKEENNGVLPDWW
jgi:hypothetical protein